MTQLRKAKRSQTKLRLALSGTSGTGKTISALLIAYGFVKDWDKIAVIDTESGSSELYENFVVDGVRIGAFNVLNLAPPFSPEAYIEAFRECEKSGAEVIIVDSASHEWSGSGGVMEIVDDAKARSSNKNAFSSGWSVATPRHNKFVENMLRSSAHVIACLRSKTEYVLENENGKQIPKKVGLAPIQREGLDYEFTIHLDLDLTHHATALKDRTGLFIGKHSFLPSVKTGETLLAWTQSGTAVPPPPVSAPVDVDAAIAEVKSISDKPKLTLYISQVPPEVYNDPRFRDACRETQKKIVAALKDSLSKSSANGATA